MARLAQSQAEYCARVGRLVHSNKFAFKGGENLAQGNSNFSPRAIVDTWLKSKAGHREYLLSPQVRKMGVGIAKSRGKTYVAWAFSDESPSYPDCPYYKPHAPQLRIKFPTIKLSYRRHGMLRTPVSLFMGFIGLLGIVLGAHGLYVYFSRVEVFLFGGEAQKLFLTFEVPMRLREAVMWMSAKGIQSWFIPAAVLAGGIIVWNYSNITSKLSKFLEKVKLW